MKLGTCWARAGLQLLALLCAAAEKGGDMQLTLLPEALATAAGARCLDSSPAAYYTVLGSGADAKRWVVYLEGGGECESRSSCESAGSRSPVSATSSANEGRASGAAQQRSMSERTEGGVAAGSGGRKPCSPVHTAACSGGRSAYGT